MINECTADLGSPPCECRSCAENEAYWRRQWERYGKHEYKVSEAEIRDCYSDPTEAAKRDILLARMEGNQ